MTTQMDDLKGAALIYSMLADAEALIAGKGRLRLAGGQGKVRQCVAAHYFTSMLATAPLASRPLA